MQMQNLKFVEKRMRSRSFFPLRFKEEQKLRHLAFNVKLTISEAGEKPRKYRKVGVSH